MKRSARERALYIAVLAYQHPVAAFLEPTGRLKVLDMSAKGAVARYERVGDATPELCIGVYDHAAPEEIEADILVATGGLLMRRAGE